MNYFRLNDNRGFTLVEAMIAVGIFSIVSIGAYSLWLKSVESLDEGSGRIQTQNKIQEISDRLSKDLRHAKEIRLIDSLQNVDTTQYAYVLQEGNEIVYYPTSMTGDMNKKVLAESIEGPDGKEYTYELNFNKDSKRGEVISYSIGIKEADLGISSSVQALNIDDPIANNSGKVLEINPPSGASLDSFYDNLDWNKFWRDFVKSSFTGTLETISDGMSFKKDTSGEDLAVGIAGSGNSQGGMMFSELTDDYFGDTNSINSYSIVVDAKMSTTNWNANGGFGYGVLIRGYYDKEEQKDWGYMVQFDPGANGIVIRRIQNNDHQSTYHVGAAVVDTSKYSDRNNEGISPLYGSVYTPYELENEEFQWNGDYTADSKAWFERYKTKIKVQTQSDDSLIIRVSLIDEQGNHSNELWFGNFGEVKYDNVGDSYHEEIRVEGGNRDDTTNGQYYLKQRFTKGDSLDWRFFTKNGAPSGSLPGRMFALRSWSSADFDVDFYEVNIAEAEPAVKNVDYSGNKVEVTFDEAVWNVDKEYFTVYKSNGQEASINNITKQGDRKLGVNFAGNLGWGGGSLKYQIPENPDESKMLEDAQGNKVKEFTIDIDEESLVQ